METACQWAIQSKTAATIPIAEHENTDKGCRGQLGRLSFEAKVNCDNSIVTMLIYTQPTVPSQKKSRYPPHTQGHHLPLLMYPLHPSHLCYSFQIHPWGDFPMPPELSPPPCPFPSLTLATNPASPIFFGVNFVTLSSPMMQEQWGVALEPAQRLISITVESHICSTQLRAEEHSLLSRHGGISQPTLQPAAKLSVSSVIFLIFCSQ